MTTAATKETKKPGNPTFVARKTVQDTDGPLPEKTYEFELIQTVDQGKPVDRDNGKPLDAPYPRIFTRPNSGIAIDEATGVARAWRYIVGQPSIWVEDQVSLEKVDKKVIDAMLGAEENQIEFIRGKCLVRGIEKLKYHALCIHDAYEAKKRQYKPVPRIYRLTNPDKEVQRALGIEDLEFKALKLAHECTEEEMLQSAYTMGINVDDITPSGINIIKSQFRSKAKYDPKNPKALESLQFFITVMENPMTKIKYIFHQGLKQGIISVSQQEGKLTWAAPNTAIMDMDAKKNVVDILTGMVLERNELAMTVYETIRNEVSKDLAD